METETYNIITSLISIHIVLGILTMSLWANYINTKAEFTELLFVGIGNTFVIVGGVIILLVGWITFVRYENKLKRRENKFKRNKSNSHLKYTTDK